MLLARELFYVKPSIWESNLQWNPFSSTHCAISNTHTPIKRAPAKHRECPDIRVKIDNNP